METSRCTSRDTETHLDTGIRLDHSNVCVHSGTGMYCAFDL